MLNVFEFELSCHHFPPCHSFTRNLPVNFHSARRLGTTVAAVDGAVAVADVADVAAAAGAAAASLDLLLANIPIHWHTAAAAGGAHMKCVIDRQTEDTASVVDRPRGSWSRHDVAARGVPAANV
jgi:hypothetical protein